MPGRIQRGGPPPPRRVLSHTEVMDLQRRRAKGTKKMRVRKTPWNSNRGRPPTKSRQTTASHPIPLDPDASQTPMHNGNVGAGIINAVAHNNAGILAAPVTSYSLSAAPQPSSALEPSVDLSPIPRPIDGDPEGSLSQRQLALQRQLSFDPEEMYIHYDVARIHVMNRHERLIPFRVNIMVHRNPAYKTTAITRRAMRELGWRDFQYPHLPGINFTRVVIVGKATREMMNVITMPDEQGYVGLDEIFLSQQAFANVQYYPTVAESNQTLAVQLIR